MTDLIWGLYPVFLDAGYGPRLFWDLGIDEINDMLESYARKKEREQKQREAALKDDIMVLFNQALQFGDVIGKIINKDTRIRIPGEYYPELFETENERDFTGQEGDKPALNREMEVHKARMDDFIFRHNMAIRKRMAGERGESGGRNNPGAAPGADRSPDKGIPGGTEESTATDGKCH